SSAWDSAPSMCGCRPPIPRSERGASVAPGEEPARHHLRLNLGRPLEDVEDACIAEDTADRVFERVAVAAMDLQCRVGIRPGGARRQQLRHPGLDVAAPPAILLARRKKGELARHHRLDGHRGELASDAREGSDRLPELTPLPRVAPAELERVLRDT